MLEEIFNPKTTLYVNTKGLYTDNESDVITINIQAVTNGDIKVLGAVGLVIFFVILIVLIIFMVWYYRKRVTSFTVGWYYNR